jgi:hypothetical protein
MIRFDNGRWQRFERLLATATVQTLVATDEAWWLGTDEGVVRLEESSCQFVNNPAVALT